MKNFHPQIFALNLLSLAFASVDGAVFNYNYFAPKFGELPAALIAGIFAVLITVLFSGFFSAVAMRVVSGRSYTPYMWALGLFGLFYLSFSAHVSSNVAMQKRNAKQAGQIAEIRNAVGTKRLEELYKTLADQTKRDEILRGKGSTASHATARKNIESKISAEREYIDAEVEKRKAELFISSVESHPSDWMIGVFTCSACPTTLLICLFYKKKIGLLEGEKDLIEEYAKSVAKGEQPRLTTRQIAEATGISLGKVSNLINQRKQTNGFAGHS